MVNAAILVAIVGVVCFAYADPIPDPNWIVASAGNPNLLINNPAMEMMRNMGGFFPKFDFATLQSPDVIVSGGGKGFHGMSTSITKKGHLDQDGKWVEEVKGSTMVNNEGKVKVYDLDGPVLDGPVEV